jgi:peroxiredoxin
MALMHSQGMPLGTPAPPFSLPATDGNTYSLDSLRDAALLVVIFTCNHCPYAKACEDRLVAIQRDYLGRGVRLVAINPNDDVAYPEDSFENMVARARDRGFNFPYLRDGTQQVARAYNAVCTPDVYVFDRERRLRYNGRVDDNWQEPAKVGRHDLRLALDALLQGRAIPFDPVPSMGCSIKWKG